ncbi:hypothetical protein NBRC116594_25170 [Shimia sp. NS0008-38b]
MLALQTLWSSAAQAPRLPKRTANAIMKIQMSHAASRGLMLGKVADVIAHDHVAMQSPLLLSGPQTWELKPALNDDQSISPAQKRP